MTRRAITKGLVKLSLVSAALMNGYFSQAIADDSVRVTQITPTGENIPPANQIMIRFSKKLVPLGDTRRTSEQLPIKIRPALNCQWQWLSANALACQLDQNDALKLATKYKITLSTGALNKAGDSLDQAFTHTFETARPEVSYAHFTGIKQRGKPAYGLNFNQSVSKRSVARAVKFQYKENGRTKQIPVSVVRHLPAENLSDQRAEENKRLAHHNYWIVQPTQFLPKDTPIELVVKPGLVSTEGNLKSLETKVVSSFQSFDEFKFLGISCANTLFRRVYFEKEELDRAKCNPKAAVSLEFSSPIDAHNFYQQLELWRDGKLSNALADAWKDKGWARIYSHHRKAGRYSLALPVGLLPDEFLEIRRIEGGEERSSIVDMLGQSLIGDIRASFKTRDYSPQLQMPQAHVVLEKGVNSDASLIATNLESINFDYQTGDGESRQLENKLTFAKNQIATIPVGIRKILNNKSGVVTGVFSSKPLTVNSQSKLSMQAQITPFQVHAKIGHFSSLVWVSDLATGNLVNNAKVEIISSKNSHPKADASVLQTEVTDKLGIALLNGLESLDPKGRLNNWCNRANCNRMFVRVTKGEDSALLPIDYNYEINLGQISDGEFYNDRREIYGHLQSWGTSAQGIYRPGDTIQYKVLVRNQSNDGLIPAPKKSYELFAEDPNGNLVLEREEVALDDQGSISGEIKLSDTAMMGWYNFVLRSSFSNHELYPLKVLVTDFTPAPFKLTQKLNGSSFLPGQELVLDLDAALHSGGPYTDAQAQVEIMAIPSVFQPDTEIAKGFRFNDYNNYGQQDLLFETRTIDAQGHASASILLPTLEDEVVSADIIAQALVEDERGKSVASRSKASYLAVDRLVGLKSTKWVYQSGKPVSLKSIVVDPSGMAIEGTDIDVRIYKDDSDDDLDQVVAESDSIAHPKGWKEVASCSITSSREASDCSFTPEFAGSYEFIATIKDTKGRPHRVAYQIWVSGRGSVYWDQKNPNALELVSEKSSFEVGETARYLVKNPYPGAKALITIERLGVLDSWQQTLEGSAPVIEVTVKDEYAPGVYLSVVVAKPRTGADLPNAGEPDENKPNFKIGYRKIEVSGSKNTLELDIETDAKVYKPGDKVTLTLKPKQLKSIDLRDIELSISVLDEAVLDLLKGGSDYFDPNKGFSKLANLDLSNYNILTRLVGLQTFSEPKTDLETKLMLANQTQGVIFHEPSIRLSSPQDVQGFAASESAVFEEVVVTASKRAEQDFDDAPKEVRARDKLVDSALWKDSVKVSKDGTVTIQFTLPDNLTAWRVLALATTPTSDMGLSQYSFKVNQLTEIRPVMPNQVTETDRFTAGFSVLNRSEKPRAIKVSVDASGSIDKDKARFETTLELAPHAREIITLPMTAKRLGERVYKGSINYIVTAGDGLDVDALKHTLPVGKQSNLSTAASYGSTDGLSVQENILIPNGVASDLGGITVQMSPTIISNVGGAFEYMRGYPYACWEQKLTKAVMASHYRNLNQYLDDKLEWPDSKDLPQDTLDIAINSQAPNGGMTYFKAENEYVSPYLSAYTALAFSWLRDAGYAIPIQVQESLHEYLNTIIKPKAELNQLSPGAASTVRAVALAALAKNGDLSRRNVLNYADNSRDMSLFGKAHLLDALKQFDDTESEQRNLLDEILANSNSSAGKIGFNETLDRSYVRLHSSAMRSSCAILDTLSANRSLITDQNLPSNLVRTIVAKRGGRSHWENTQDNVYCLNALAQYASVYEADVPSLTSKISLNQEVLGSAEFSSFTSPVKEITLPMRADLIGEPKTLSIKHSGVGRLYYQTRLQFSKLGEQLQRENAGMDIRRERSVFRDDKWQLINPGDQIHRGETIRTDLFFSTPVERNFVAVRDPVPGGLEPVNPELATDGASLKLEQLNQPASGSYFFEKTRWQGLTYSPWGFYHQQLGHDAVTFYSDYIEKGEYHLSYLAQAIATGEFIDQPVHAEEMYHPDVYGKGRSGKLLIVE